MADLDPFQVRPGQQTPPGFPGENPPGRACRNAAPARDDTRPARPYRGRFRLHQQALTIVCRPPRSSGHSAKREQFEVTREMLADLRNEIRAATSTLQLFTSGTADQLSAHRVHRFILVSAPKGYRTQPLWAKISQHDLLQFRTAEAVRVRRAAYATFPWINLCH